MNPVVLVCRSVGDRHELWGISAKADVRWFTLIGTVIRPQDFRNRIYLGQTNASSS